MDRVCPTKDAEGNPIVTCPEIDNWHGRIDKYKQQVKAIP